MKYSFKIFSLHFKHMNSCSRVNMWHIMLSSHFSISPRGFDAVKSRMLLRHFCSITVFMLLLSALSQVLITVCHGVLLMNISVWDQTCVFTWASCVTASPTALMEETRGRTAEVMTTNIAWSYIATYNCYMLYINITSINNISLTVENKAWGVKQILVELVNFKFPLK